MNYETYQTLTHGMNICRGADGLSVVCPVHDLNQPAPKAPIPLPTVEEMLAEFQGLDSGSLTSVTPTGPETTITLGKGWWYDHRDRCDDHGCREVTPIKVTKTTVTVTLTQSQLDDMEKDARFYADSGRHLDPEVARVMVPMARRALARIEKVKE